MLPYHNSATQKWQYYYIITIYLPKISIILQNESNTIIRGISQPKWIKPKFDTIILIYFDSHHHIYNFIKERCTIMYL